MNYLLVGKAGSGKTTAACTGKPPIFLIDVDGKADQMENIQPLVKKGDVIIHQVKSKLIEDDLVYRALNPNKPIKIQPKGYVEVLGVLNDVIEKNIAENCNTVVLDSLTRVCEHMKRLLIYHRGTGVFGKAKEGDMNWPSWGSYLSNLEELFSALTKYIDQDFICTVHEKVAVERDPLTEVETVTGYWPAIDGSMREKLPGFFNEVYWMHRRDIKGKPPEFMFRTAGNKYCARTSKKLDELVPAALTLSTDKK